MKTTTFVLELVNILGEPSSRAQTAEFNSNLTLNTWATVPNYTNNFANGTNTTTFNRLDPICGPNVFLRVRNQSQ